jgi:signal transduction histidine kinase/ligand-binding sensor domain-containing protein
MARSFTKNPVRVFLGVFLICFTLFATSCRGTAAPAKDQSQTEDQSSSSSEQATGISVSLPGLTAGQHLRFEHISSKQGLSQNTVFCILQDNQGFMWFCTEDGLNKYDGYGFTVFRHDPEDPNSLSDSRILSIIQDRTGILWVGTANGGLNKFDMETNQITRYLNDPDDPNSLSDNRVFSIFEDEDGELWIGTEYGLNRFVRETQNFIHYQKDPNDPKSLSGDSVRVIYQDHEGILWFGTNAGLNRFDPDKGQFTHFQNEPDDEFNLSHNSIRAIYQDSERALWVGTDDGLNKLQSGSERFIQFKQGNDNSPGLNSSEISSIFEDSSGVLWIGTIGGGLNSFNRDTETFINFQSDHLDPYSLSNNFVRSIFQDREGDLWFGTIGGGLDKLDIDKRVFAHYQQDHDNPNSLSSNWVRSFYEDRSGTIWIGTTDGGLNQFDPVNERFTHYVNDPSNPDSLSHNHVSHISQDSQGMLWIGTGSGIDKLDPSTGIFTHYQHDPEDLSSLSENNGVMLIIEDRKGVLWVGTSGGGLNRFDRETETFTRFLHDPNDPQSLINNDVWNIVQTRDGTLWISTGGGLDRYEPETESFTHYLNDPEDPASLSHNFVGAILEDQNGVLWLGTIGGGLNKLDRATGRFTHFREKEGLPSDVILGIVDDDQGYFWLSSLKGLAKFDPRTETIQNYYETDGLHFEGFTGGALMKSSDGRIYAGGLEGFIAFHPDQLHKNTYIPPIAVTKINLDGEEIFLDGSTNKLPEIVLEWPDNTFEFEYAALSYANPEENRYSYYLDGLEETWNEVGTRRYGRYTSLPGGTYTLHVKGSNNDGVWNETGSELKITVIPPYWETWWFRGAVLLLLAGGAIGGYRLRVRNLEARSLELESQVEQRTLDLMKIQENLKQSEMEKAISEERARLARDLHDSVTQSIYSLTLLAEAGQRMIKNGDIQQAEVNHSRLREIAQQALQEMRLLVYELRPQVLRSEGLIGALEQRLEAVERRAGIDARLVVDDEFELPAELEVELLYISQEALNNALKHSNASEVVLSIRADEDNLSLEVVDNGTGFDLELARGKRGMGLTNISERVEKIRGKLTIQSLPDHGTTIRVTAPMVPPENPQTGMQTSSDHQEV